MTELNHSMPVELEAWAQSQWQQWWSHLNPSQQEKIQDDRLKSQFFRAVVGSEYFSQTLLKNADDALDWLVAVANQSLSSAMLMDDIRQQCAGVQNSDELDRALRMSRKKYMLAIIFLDLNRITDCVQTTALVSTLASTCLQVALDFHYSQMTSRFGVPMGRESGQAQPMLIIGMGKLGGGELNLSSDIDLLFAYPESGETQGAKKSIDNQTFFNRCGQAVINSLNTITADGFVFRVDMRLRPYGQSGALTSSFAALAVYYQTQGREWERFAMVKARVVASVVAGERESIIEQSIEELDELLQAFTYRKYIDFSVIESLRNLKDLINQEVRRRALDDDVKLGAGGIREIEFIVQTFQLIRAGRQHTLRERSLLAAMQRLRDLNYIDAEDGAMLKAAYLFLRNLEHLLQAWRDEQTQQMPTDSLAIARLAWLMGCSSSEEFKSAFEQHRRSVHQAFLDVVADPDHEKQTEWQVLWKTSQKSQVTWLQSEEPEVDEPPEVFCLLQDFREQRSIQLLGANARANLDIVLPVILSQVESNEVLKRLLDWLAAIAGRSVYLTLLVENPEIIASLVNLFGSSSWVAEQLTQSPSLLDELLNEESLYRIPSKDWLATELRQQLLRIPEDDLEVQMDALRYFKQSHSLKVAASDLSGKRELMKTSDYLTYLAEVILTEVLALAMTEMSRQYGQPEGDFIMVGYGKLGGIEMSYSSDLDLVFIYQADPQATTPGPKSIDYHTFYTRLGQKIIHLLTTRMNSGQLYEVDMRLRPSGSSGLLVSTMAAFERYQKENAWVWEHQALVRARVVSGAPQLAEQFAQLRQRVLASERDQNLVREEVLKMRDKMREHLLKPGNLSKFDLKQGVGGIVDIEFMVQYAVLAWAHQVPELAKYTDNIRILDALQAEQRIGADSAQFLIDTYQTYRMAAHRLALQQQPAMIDADCYIEERQRVQAIWQSIFSL